MREETFWGSSRRHYSFFIVIWLFLFFVCFFIFFSFYTSTRRFSFLTVFGVNLVEYTLFDNEWCDVTGQWLSRFLAPEYLLISCFYLHYTYQNKHVVTWVVYDMPCFSSISFILLYHRLVAQHWIHSLRHGVNIKTIYYFSREVPSTWKQLTLLKF